MGCIWSSESAIGKGVRMILVEESLVIQILPYNLYFPHTKNLVKYWASRQNLFLCLCHKCNTADGGKVFSLHIGKELSAALAQHERLHTGNSKDSGVRGLWDDCIYRWQCPLRQCSEGRRAEEGQRVGWHHFWLQWNWWGRDTHLPAWIYHGHTLSSHLKGPIFPSYAPYRVKVGRSFIGTSGMPHVMLRIFMWDYAFRGLEVCNSRFGWKPEK